MEKKIVTLENAVEHLTNDYKNEVHYCEEANKAKDNLENEIYMLRMNIKDEPEDKSDELDKLKIQICCLEKEIDEKRNVTEQNKIYKNI